MNPTQSLADRLSTLLGGEIRGLTRLSGGASRETWSFDLVTASGEVRELILRRDPVGRPIDPARKGSMLVEARFIRLAAEAGMPVPEVVAAGDENDGLETGFVVMTRVPGETIARKILRDEPYAHARSVVVRQLGAAAAKLHQLNPALGEGLDSVDPLEKYRQALREFNYPSPAFELALRWLDANRPAPRPASVVHGDYRFGNVLIDETGLAAVLDWELVHLGDPIADLGWICVRAWRFGGRGEAAGMGSIAELVEGYRSAGGVVEESEVRWWMTAGTFMWGVMCLGQASAHFLGARSVELAAIGRRVAEQEHDLLVLLGADAECPVVPAASSTVAEFGPNGMPGAAQLLEAVREYLQRDVMGATTGRVNFHARVASNVVAIVERELTMGPDAEASMRADHAALGVADERELADAIRAGRLDGRSDEVLLAVRRAVTSRLAIANPKYFTDRA